MKHSHTSLIHHIYFMMFTFSHRAHIKNIWICKRVIPYRHGNIILARCICKIVCVHIIIECTIWCNSNMHGNEFVHHISALNVIIITMTRRARAIYGFVLLRCASTWDDFQMCNNTAKVLRTLYTHVLCRIMFICIIFERKIICTWFVLFFHIVKCGATHLIFCTHKIRRFFSL